MTERPFVVLDELSGTPLFTDRKIDGNRMGPGPPCPPPLPPQQLIPFGLPESSSRLQVGHSGSQPQFP